MLAFSEKAHETFSFDCDASSGNTGNGELDANPLCAGCNGRPQNLTNCRPQNSKTVRLQPI